MREILFRGKQKDNGVWLQGDLRQWSEKRKGICDYDLKHTIEVDSSTIGQYTGLTDKNGKRIFEGDVLQFQGNVVEFCNGGFCINGDVPLAAYKNAEIIGNIHDNPEKEKSKNVERWKV